MYKKLIWEKQWSGGSKKDEDVYTILLTTPEYHNLLPAVCTLIEVAGVQWMDSATCERGFSIRTLTKTGQRYWLGDSLLAAVMMIDMNGLNHDIQAADEVKALILESVNALKNYKKRMPSRSTARCNPKEQERTGHK